MRSLIAASALLLAGCGDALGPGQEPHFRVQADPAVVAPGESFDLLVTLTNPGPDPVRVWSGCGGVWYTLSADRPGDDVLLHGGVGVCPAAMGLTTIPAGVTTTVHRVHLESPDGSPAAPGDYEVRLHGMLHGVFQDRDDGADQVTVQVRAP